jgi:L-ascorbate metabolism protein UlaG (beta-lactamase superfamily)
MQRTSFVIAWLWLTACGSHTPPPEVPRHQPADPSWPPPASLTYLGVAGWSLRSGEHTMLFDPYVTRSKVDDFDAIVVPDSVAIGRYVPAKADVIVVSHSHFDHLLDVPAIALRTGAVVFGTSSTGEVARASQVPDNQIVRASGGAELRFPAFHVRAVEAAHSLIDDSGLSKAAIAPSPRLPMRARDYHEGGTLQYWVSFAGHTLYFVGTANFVEAQLQDVNADIAIVAIGLRDKVPDYTCRLLRALGLPKLVLPNHFDAWQEPMHAGEITLSDEARADLAAFEKEVHACAPDARVITPQWLTPIAL